MTKPKDQYQTVWISFNDGTKHPFTGKAIVWPDDMPLKRIVDIAFSVPRDLPDGCSFEEIETKLVKA